MSADLIMRLRDSLALISNPCEACHHAFGDRHSMMKDCPIAARINALIAEADELEAQLFIAQADAALPLFEVMHLEPVQFPSIRTNPTERTT